MSWKNIKLDNAITTSKGKKHNEVRDVSATRYIQIEDLNGSYTPKFTKDKGVEVNNNDVIIVWDGANAGKVGTNLTGVIGSTLARLRPVSSEINGSFLYRYLQSKENEIKSKRTGATIPHVNGTELRNMLIPFPPLTIQQKIAAILDQADNLRKKDQQLLAKYDELLQSVFYDMFGDPVKNEKGWEKVKLGDLCELVSSGSTPLGGAKVYQKDGIMFIRSQNVLMNEFDVSDVSFISDEIHNKMKRTWVKNNDVLLNITGASIGRVAVYNGKDDKANVNQHVSIIRLIKGRMAPIFLSYHIATDNFQNKYIGASQGGTREAFTFSSIKSFDVILPPIILQNKFAIIAQNIQQQKQQLTQQIEQSENLFQSLLQRAFKGELVKEY